MAVKRMNVKKTIQMLYKAVIGHIGSNGSEAHLAANEFTNGFMTSEHVKNLNEAKGKRTWKSRVDPWMQPAGHYEGSYLLNVPDPVAIYQYDIFEGMDGRKQAYLMPSATGEIYFRNVHTDGIVGSNPSGWTRIYREVVIWNGSKSTVSDILECTQNPRNFSKVRIEADINGVGLASVTIENLQNNVSYAIQGLNLSDTSNSSIFEVYEIRFALISGETNFTIVGNKKISATGTANEIQTSGLAKITKIVGIK
ncbi:hypothetical protein BH745_15590 [Enterococcus gallinarum]|uniref:hypothetical protein n=1 Tax=Enterococcus gallinarum TaxID=1353 RepID=UPI0009C09E49|nr:hypothetical protein [Enterococcus gallinarum]OQO76916.1 hypothetical protein BH745_15590 [Enterococcus gallinarum]